MIDATLNWLFANRRITVAALAGITVIMAIFASQVEVKAVFTDLLPQNHPFVNVNDEFKHAYGGSNVVSVMVEVEDGDILRPEILEKIQKITKQVAVIPAADPFQVTSLASKQLKVISSSSTGIETRPIMWPDLPANEAQRAELRRNIINSSLIYGAYVAEDFKSALITVDFYDHLLDYSVFFDHITKIMEEHEEPGVTIRVVGEPMLYGWVLHYFGETVLLFFGTILALFIVLFLIARTWHGTIIPLIAAGVSATWAIGFAGILGFHLDPLIVVVALLITAVAVSNAIQVVERFDHTLESGEAASPVAAGRETLRVLFRPAMLAVISGAGCIIVVAKTPIPLLQMIAIVGGFWLLSLAVCAFLLPGLLATWTNGREKPVHHINLRPAMHFLLGQCVRLTVSRWRFAVVGGAAVILAISGYYAFNLKVGDANPGSPILRAKADYNIDAAALNSTFQGADRMFVVIDGKKDDAIKQPATLDTMERFMRHMEAQPEIGGSTSIVDILPSVNQMLHEGNPRYHELGSDAIVNGELAYLFVSGSDPGDLQRYVAPDYSNASVTLFFRDHQGDTIRKAVARIEEFVADNPLPNDGEYLLAGGLIGVLAAVNDVILQGQIQAIALALLVLAFLGAVTYRSFAAGTLLMIPIVISNTLTFSYMAYFGIGMTINTLPVVALGIGCGIDYTFYVVDAIREEMHKHGDLNRAITSAMRGAGMGVLTTVLTLVVSVSLWSISSLRLQSEMASLISIWLAISAVAALVLMPAVIAVFRPAFVVGPNQDKQPRTAGVEAGAAAPTI